MAAGLSSNPVVLVLGASTAAGQFFLSRAERITGIHLLAVSRQSPTRSHPSVTWLQHDLARGAAPAAPGVLVSFGPVGLVATQVEATREPGRVVALSSASTLFKSESDDPKERALMEEISAQEQRLVDLCAERNAVLSLFKPTMIYGGGRDANVSRLAGLIRRLPLVPVAGSGLRSPVHADDLAALAWTVLSMGERSRGTWLLGGGERLTYPDMLGRIAAAQGCKARLLPVPARLLRAGLSVAHGLGRLRDLNAAMLARQADDLVVDDGPARERLGWNPRLFSP
jgi:nucleoside-diphosphate-sugar epimerase